MPEVRVRIAGDGPDEYRRSLVELAAECSVEDRVEWLGFVSGSARDRFLDSLDIVAMPSVYECFGMAVAEAMARGVPPVVSPDCGIAETVLRRACGVVVPSHVGDWAAEFSRLAHLESLDELRMLSLGAARTDLSMAAFGEGIRHEYERLARLS